jgi:hypothetical protein
LRIGRAWFVDHTNEKPLAISFRKVAAGLPRHLSSDLNTGLRRKAAATSGLNRLPADA